MGCTSGKTQVHISPNRRRLSLGELGPGNDHTYADVTEEDRSLFMTLSQKQIMEFVEDGDDFSRKYSIGSETDEELHHVQSFTSKSVSLHGEQFNPEREGIGFACKKGLKPEAPNQDSFFIMKVADKYSVYGVFDGHGRKGHDVSNFVKENLPKILLSQESLQEDPETALARTFDKTQYLIEKATAMKQIDASRSGTTCSVVLHDHKKRMLYVAHVGDSRVVLGKSSPLKDGTKAWASVDLTIDHKPDLPEERKRIEKNGGMVVFDGGWNYRVYAKGKKDSRGKRYPGLNMSRAMGDLSGFHDAGISATPDVSKNLVAVHPCPSTAPLQNGRRPSTISTSSHPSVSSHTIDESDKLLCLCSDGVWEFVTSEQAIKFISKFSKDKVETAAEQLASVAWNEWIKEMDGKVVDDITALVIHL